MTAPTQRGFWQSGSAHIQFWFLEFPEITSKNIYIVLVFKFDINKLYYNFWFL